MKQNDLLAWKGAEGQALNYFLDFIWYNFVSQLFFIKKFKLLGDISYYLLSCDDNIIMWHIIKCILTNICHMIVMVNSSAKAKSEHVTRSCRYTLAIYWCVILPS